MNSADTVKRAFSNNIGEFSLILTGNGSLEIYIIRSNYLNFARK